MSLPTSPIEQKSSSIPPPWSTVLMKSYQQNYARRGRGDQEKKIYLPMCNMKRSGEISMHCLPFQGFLKDDIRFMKFTLAMNDHVLMGDIKTNPNAKINWMMAGTEEYYNFKGKFYIASAPIQITRYPPPKINHEQASEYWENERIEQWNELDERTRAEFTWPSRAEVPKSKEINFSCQSLKNDESSVIHDLAMDNFCLLVYKVTDVEYFNYSCYPPKRLFYTWSLKNECWDIQTSNP